VLKAALVVVVAVRKQPLFALAAVLRAKKHRLFQLVKVALAKKLLAVQKVKRFLQADVAVARQQLFIGARGKNLVVVSQ